MANRSLPEASRPVYETAKRQIAAWISEAQERYGLTADDMIEIMDEIRMERMVAIREGERKRKG